MVDMLKDYTAEDAERSSRFWHTYWERHHERQNQAFLRALGVPDFYATGRVSLGTLGVSDSEAVANWEAS